VKTEFDFAKFPLAECLEEEIRTELWYCATWMGGSISYSSWMGVHVVVCGWVVGVSVG